MRIDDHDKLKPFGFSVHGCIDGFSRNLIWLKVGSSNEIPDVIAHYYVNVISELGSVPHIIKADDRTRHALIEPIHIYLRSINEEEGIQNTFSITPLPQNQRIEAYWSILQRDRLGWWKRFLLDLSDNDMLDTSDPVILDCVRYSFIDLIRYDLNLTKEELDSHIISKSRNWGPSGRPTCMYNLPHLYDVQDYLHDTDFEELQELDGVVDSAPIADYSTKFQEFAEYLMEEDELEPPSNPN